MFFAALVAVALLRMAVGLVALPYRFVPIGSLVISVLFVALPILAFYKGASFPWNGKHAILLVIVGILVQIIGGVGVPMSHSSMQAGVLNAFGQTGLLLWAFGLGALLTSVLRDRNILLPVAL